MPSRLMTNICSDNPSESVYFYTKLFDLEVAFESDWFVHLVAKDKNLELGIIDRNNELVPGGFKNHPQGFYITFVVEDVDKICRLANQEYFEILSQPADTTYGQRRMLLKDPNGALIDVSSLMKDNG